MKNSIMVLLILALAACQAFAFEYYDEVDIGSLTEDYVLITPMNFTPFPEPEAYTVIKVAILPGSTNAIAKSLAMKEGITLLESNIVVPGQDTYLDAIFPQLLVQGSEYVQKVSITGRPYSGTAVFVMNVYPY